MSMQSLLVVNGYANLSEAIWDMYVEAAELHAQLVRCIKDAAKRRSSERVALETPRRTLPDLRRGVMHQQYPQFGIAWPYIKRKHTHDRNDKYGKHPYPRPLDCGAGLEVWSAAGKRLAKRINNKRRRAEDKREIAREMDWWACDPQHGDAVDEFDGLAWCYVRSTGLEVYPANVFVPTAQECFCELGGANLDMLYADDFTN